MEKGEGKGRERKKGILIVPLVVVERGVCGKSG